MNPGGWHAARMRRKWLRAVLLASALALCLLPLFWTLLASVGIMPDNSARPPTWSLPPTLENYLEVGVVTPTFLTALVTSIILALVTTLLTVAVALLAAYGLTQTHMRRVVPLFLVLASIPVMAYVLPQLVVVRGLHLYDTFPGAALAECAVLIPLAVFVLYGYVRQVTPDLQESARLEGASTFTILRRIVLPISAPGVAATSIIVFVLSWNLLLVPMVLTESRVMTIPVLLTDFFRLEREIDWASAAAVLVISLVPLLALALAAQRLLDQFHLVSVETN